MDVDSAASIGLVVAARLLALAPVLLVRDELAGLRVPGRVLAALGPSFVPTLLPSLFSALAELTLLALLPLWTPLLLLSADLNLPSLLSVLARLGTLLFLLTGLALLPLLSLLPELPLLFRSALLSELTLLSAVSLLLIVLSLLAVLPLLALLSLPTLAAVLVLLAAFLTGRLLLSLSSVGALPRSELVLSAPLLVRLVPSTLLVSSAWLAVASRAVSVHVSFPGASVDRAGRYAPDSPTCTRQPVDSGGVN